MRARKCFFGLFIAVVLILVHAIQSGAQPIYYQTWKGHPKIESGLAQLAKEYEKNGPSSAKEFAIQRGMTLGPEGMITVFLLPEFGRTKDAIDIEALWSYGGEVIKTGDHIIKATIPLSSLTGIADRVEGISLTWIPTLVY
jgi:hypothetical protein